jgi:hypothetical protein
MHIYKFIYFFKVSYIYRHISIYLPIYGSTAICWVLAAFQFFELLHSRQDSLEGWSARRKAATYTQ